MEPVFQKQVQQSLHEKREHLSHWLESSPLDKRQVTLGPASQADVQTHLEVMDTAIDKASAGALGVCEVCKGSIDTELLEMDYTVCVCLDDLSLHERRALELELELAQTVQRSLLPYEVPDTPHLETAAFSRPAQIISGDYFDFFRFQDGAHGLAIGDVAGHGVSASLHMASMQALLRTLIPSSRAPHEVVEHINRLMIHNVRFATFMSFFLAAFDPSTYTLTYCNAGHTPPLLFRRNDGMDSVRLLGPTGAAIGLVEDVPFSAETLQLAHGDVLLMCTDGVTEAINQKEELFGLERLTRLVHTAWDHSPRDLILEIRQALGEFTAGLALEDDVTIVACKVIG
jgi:sigma-B regulation protein RsbU (phosphoserine phosphatase)